MFISKQIPAPTTTAVENVSIEIGNDDVLLFILKYHLLCREFDRVSYNDPSERIESHLFSTYFYLNGIIFICKNSIFGVLITATWQPNFATLFVQSHR